MQWSHSSPWSSLSPVYAASGPPEQRQQPQLTRLVSVSLCAGHRRPGAAAADAVHRPRVHGPEAGARHQAVSPDRARQDGLLQAVRQMRTPVAPPAGCGLLRLPLLIVGLVDGTPRGTLEPSSVRNSPDYKDTLFLFFCFVFLTWNLCCVGEAFLAPLKETFYFPFSLWGYPNCWEEMYFII